MEEDIQNHSPTVMFRGTPCKLLYVLSMLYKNCKKKSFVLLTEPTGDILQTTLRYYLKIVHRKNVSLILNES